MLRQQRLRRSPWLAMVSAGVCLVLGACVNDRSESVDTATEAATETAAETASEPATETATDAETATSEPETSDSEDESSEPETSEPESEEAEPEAPVGVACGSGDPIPVGRTDIVLDAGGAEHDVAIFLPSSFDGTPLPAVVNWHGLGSTGPQQAGYSDYESLAEAEGFIVVHPTGVPAPGDDRNSWELADIQDPNRDDVAFAVALFDDLIARWCVDGDRIFSTGMSNGGFFTARLVCEIPERLAGAVSVAGIYHPPGCSPSESVPFQAYHGTDDEVVPYDGSGESTLSDGTDEEASAFFSQVMPDEFAEFAQDAGCGEPQAIQLSAEVTRYDYPGCEVEMTFFELVGSGHTWPGSPLGPATTALLGFTTDDVSATEDGWAFFASIAEDDG